MYAQLKPFVISRNYAYHSSNDKSLMSLWDGGVASRRALCLYFYCRARVKGHIYGKARQRTLDKMGWGKAAYYRNIALMRSYGLISADQWGNHALLRSSEFRRLGNNHLPRHKSTIMLDRSCTMKQVRSSIAAKFIERRLHQLTRKRGEQKISGASMKPSSRRYYSEPFGMSAMMSTRQLTKHIRMSRSWVVRWKREDTFFHKENRIKVFPMVAAMKEKPPGIHYFDKRGNGIQVRPTILTPLAPYLPQPRTQRTISLDQK